VSPPLPFMTSSGGPVVLQDRWIYHKIPGEVHCNALEIVGSESPARSDVETKQH
jgi:hypothetical protein